MCFDSSPLSDICAVNIFPVGTCLFIFLQVYFGEQKCLILMMSNLSICLHYDLCFLCGIQKVFAYSEVTKIPFYVFLEGLQF